MAIIVIKRPYDRNWSGNPIHYTLYSAAAEADATNYFEYRIKFKRTDEAAYSTVITLPYRPVNGTAQIDIQDILDGLLEYELPYLPDSAEYASPYNSNKMTGKFYLEFREITTADADPDWDDTEDGNELFVIKGGLSFHKWRGDNYWINYYDNLKPFLGWEKNNSLHSITERMYLSWLNLTDVHEGDIKMKRTVRFTDGTESVSLLNCPVPKYNVCYFPSGGSQLELQSVDPSKIIYWWELQVIDTLTNPNEPLSEPFRFYMDNRQDYNAITLNYRGSLGNIGSARIRGLIDYTANRSFTENERVVLHDYFINHFVPGRIGSINSSEIQVLKGDIGYLGKEEQDRLRDINFRREVWWEQQKKWMPVHMLTQSNKLRLSTDKLFSLPLEFCIAAGEEFYYTPESINLAEAASDTALACNAVINTLAVNYVPGTGWIVSWVLASGGPPVKYQVSTPGVSGGAPGETITTSYTFPWLPVGDNIITVKPICSIGGEFYFGAAEMVTATVDPACVNVGISGAPIYIPDAIAGLVYNYVINLTGTAPFTLSNIVKPAWMNIDVVGSTIEITGAPAGGDIGTDIDVSFTIENCAAAGSVNYADTINVIAGGASGNFNVFNEVTGINYITQIHSGGAPFYTVVIGAFPVVSGESVIGYLTQAVASFISVKVALASSSSIALQLWKNGAMVEQMDTPATGMYSFASLAYLQSDNMEIKLIFS